MSTETFTLTPEGAKLLHGAVEMGDGQVVAVALGAASRGDFGPLRALTGEAEEKPVAPDFRVGDVVVVVGNGPRAELTVYGCERDEGGAWAVVASKFDTAKFRWLPRDLSLLRRRTFRAGECPPVAVGQDRDCGIGTRRVTRIDDGIATFDDGGGCRAEIAAGLRLAAPFTFAEAVEVTR